MLDIYQKCSITPYTPNLDPTLLEGKMEELLEKAWCLQPTMTRYRLLHKIFPAVPKDRLSIQKYALLMLTLKCRSNAHFLINGSKNVSFFNENKLK